VTLAVQMGKGNLIAPIGPLTTLLVCSEDESSGFLRTVCTYQTTRRNITKDGNFYL